MPDRRRRKSGAHTRAIRHNLNDVMEHGPRLSYGRRTAVVATCKREGSMLLTGLGGMGVGTMWVERDKRKRSVPDFKTESDGNRWYYATYWGFPEGVKK